MSLLGSLNAGKKPHRKYTIELGIEKFECTIPLSEASKFETRLEKVNPSKASQLKAIIEEFGGRLN
jgi:hypothetical protein